MAGDQMMPPSLFGEPFDPPRPPTSLDHCSYCGSATPACDARVIRGNGTPIPSTAVLAETGAAILRAEPPDRIGPIHYVDLGDMVCVALGWVPCCQENRRQIAEHVRQQAQLCAKYGLGYVDADGPLHGLIYDLAWFDFARRLFWDGSRLQLQLDFDSAKDAMIDGMNRRPYLHNTFGDAASVIDERFSRGMLVQKMVSGKFKALWPLLYLEPTNHKKYTEAAADDFRLKYDGKIVKVDVKTLTRRSGLYESYAKKAHGKKPDADIYVLAKPTATSAELRGWCLADEIENGVQEEQARPIEQLYVRLNCAARGLDHRLLRKLASEVRR